MKTLILITLLPLLLAAQEKTHKVDFSQVLIGADGKALPNGEKKLTLGDVSGGALMALLDEDKNATGQDKYKLFVLAQKVMSNKDMTVEDITLIKTRIGKAYAPGVVGPAWN